MWKEIIDLNTTTRENYEGMLVTPRSLPGGRT